MSKLKSLIPKIFSSNNNKKSAKNDTVGRLEKDACGVYDDGNEDQNVEALRSPASPTASTELTESVVRELSDPNYNSTSGAVMERSNTPLRSPGTTNSLNVQNNQQQNIVMQISNANNVHFGSVYNFNNNITANNQKLGSPDELKGDFKNGDGKRRTQKTRTIHIMMQSQDELNHRMMDTISTHLGEGWKQVMRDLGHSEGVIDQAIIDNQMHGGIKEVIYCLLLQWKRRADDNEATLGHITKLLWETDHRDCVERMKIVWKSEEKKNHKVDIEL